MWSGCASCAPSAHARKEDSRPVARKPAQPSVEHLPWMVIPPGVENSVTEHRARGVVNWAPR